MVADLSRLQSAQDELVKPSTSSTLDIDKLPASQHTRAAAWYSSVGYKVCADPTSGAPGFL